MSEPRVKSGDNITTLRIRKHGGQVFVSGEGGAAKLTAAQSRMARAALGWSVRVAGKQAGCGANTVNRFEGGTEARDATRRALLAAYERAGLIFIPENGDGPGVRLRKHAAD